MFILKCPGCKNTMKYQNMTSDLKGKNKKCVYCGKSFSVKNNILKKI